MNTPSTFRTMARPLAPNPNPNPLRTFLVVAWRFGLPAILAGCALTAGAAAGGGNLEKTQKLAAVLQSQAPLFDKARACQQLGEIGSKEAVPALAGLLADEQLSAYARSGLEGIPDPSAAAALRTALGTVKGALLAGVINSLGVLRDSEAVGALRPLAQDPASGVAKEALLALGRIATGDSIPILRQALLAGPEAVRADAAAACLLAAEKQLADGHAETAVMLNDAVRTASVPAVYRAAATRGAILARRSDGVAFLIGQLRAEDPVVRKAALLTIREMPGPALAGALNAELDKAGPELELQLLGALADCHNAQSLQLLEARTAADDPEVRRTALRVLASIAGPSQAGVLLKVLMEDRTPAESTVARSSLERMEGAAVDDLVLEALVSAQDARARVQLTRLLEARGATNALAQLLKQAADPDETVSLAAFGALRALAGAREVPALIALTKACKNERVKDAAEKAICSAASSAGIAEAAGDAVLAELARSAEPAQKNAWVRVLTSLGYAKALPALEAAMTDANEAVAANAIENLGNWPDPSPVEALLAVLDTGASPRSRQRALASVIELATAAADEHQRPDALVVGWLQRASPAAHSPAEQRQVISVLGRLKRLESLRLLLPWLDQPDLQTEAALAVVQIAPALVDSEDSAALKGALEKIGATAKDPDLRGRAVKLAQSIAASGGALSLHLRRLVETEPGSGQWRQAETVARWDPRGTAVVICDMWDKHWCQGATARVAEMAPRMNQVIAELRRRGALIIHCPSETMDFYRTAPGRRLAQGAPKVDLQAIMQQCLSRRPQIEPPLPIDDSDGGCDDVPRCQEGKWPPYPWSRQIATLQVEDGDAITDSAEAYYLMHQRGITNVMVMGVHENMCVLGRPFAIRQMVKLGQNVVLMRDLTDTMYNSRRRPWVDHFTGTDLVCWHIEKYWCPTITSDQIIGGRPFRFAADTKPPRVFRNDASKIEGQTR